MSFLFLADAHIKARTWTNSMLLSGDAYAALGRLGEQVSGLPDPIRPGTLVIGGDWFDGNRPSSTDLKATMDFLRLFRRVLYIRGNHDCVVPSYLESDMTVSGLHEVTCLDGRGLDCEVGGVPVAGLSWRQSRESLLADIAGLAELARSSGRDTLYLVLHAPFRHLLGFDGSWQLDADELEPLLAGLTVRVLVGDIHVNGLLERPWGYVYSPGSLYPLSVTQMDQPFSGSLIDPETGSVALLDCRVRRYLKTSCESQETLAEAVRQAVGPEPDGLPLEPYVEVTAPEGVSSAQLDGVRLRVVPAGQESPVQAGERESEGSVSLLDSLREECGGPGDLYDLAAALQSADDPLAEIEGWLQVWQPARI